MYSCQQAINKIEKIDKKRFRENKVKEFFSKMSFDIRTLMIYYRTIHNINKEIKKCIGTNKDFIVITYDPLDKNSLVVARKACVLLKKKGFNVKEPKDFEKEEMFIFSWNWGKDFKEIEKKYFPKLKIILE